MSKPSRRKQQKKLRKARRERVRRVGRVVQTTNLAYFGRKYQTDDLAPLVAHAETGILEAWEMTGRQFTDRDVAVELQDMIRQMRSGNSFDWERLEFRADGDYVPSLVAFRILDLWRTLFASQGARRPGRDAIIGVLRTILGSIERHREPHRPFAYLEFIKAFLGQLGARVREVSEEELEELIDSGQLEIVADDDCDDELADDDLPQAKEPWESLGGRPAPPRPAWRSLFDRLFGR